MELVALVFMVNAVAGALLYLDVVRNGRSGWWLLAFWAFGPFALVAYLVRRRQASA